MLTSTKNMEQNTFLYIFENYLLRVNSVQTFSFIWLVDEKLTLGIGRGVISSPPPNPKIDMHKNFFR